MKAVLERIVLPSFGVPTVEPEIGKAEYEARIAAARERAETAGYDVLVVYGDREHWANITFLCGYDPRFEESLLVLARGRTPALVVGNEGMGFSKKSPLDLERKLYQQLSLMGQPRGDSPTLEALLRGCGLGKGTRVGIADWKYFGPDVGPGHRSWINAPAWLARAVAEITGLEPRNATDLFMDPTYGLRTTSGADQLACLEFGAAFTTEAMKRTLFGMKPGMSEAEAAELARWNCMPWACHPVLGSGPRADLVAYPSLRRMERGDPLLWSLSSWGSLSARAGFLVERAEELPEGIRDWLDRLVKPYFLAAAAWYGTVGIGVTGGEVFDAVNRHLRDPFFGFALPPGHLIHLEEWVHTPIGRGSRLPLLSGMALQADIIPSTGGPYFTTNIEDGIALADEALRQEIASRWPEAWGRIQARRRFMEEILGIRLKSEVLPFSNIGGWLAPYMLDPTRAMALR
jgi:hypothetical protein